MTEPRQSTVSTKLAALAVGFLIVLGIGVFKGLVREGVQGGSDGRAGDLTAVLKGGSSEDGTVVQAVRDHLSAAHATNPDDGIGDLVALVDHADAVVRRRAIRSLREIYGPRAAPAEAAFRKALADRDPRVQAEASLALAALGRGSAAESSPAIVERLRSPDPGAREAAFSELRALGREAIPILAQALRHESCRLEAAVALAGLDGDAARATAEPVLREIARGSPDEAARRRAIDVLAGAGWDPTPLLLEALEGADPERQVWAYGELHRLGRLEALGPRHETATPAIARALGTPGADAAAAEAALRRIGETATFQLFQSLQSEDPELRRGAIRGLALVGSDVNGELIQALFAAWKEAPDEETRLAVRDALERIQVSPDSLGVLQGRWAVPDLEQRAAALSLLARVAMQSDYALQLVLGAVWDGNDVALEAVFGAWERLGPAAVPVLETFLERAAEKPENPAHRSAGPAPAVVERARRALESARDR